MWKRGYFTAEQEDGLLVNVWICLRWFVVQAKPWICLETHQANLFVSSDQEHDITVRLFRLVKQLLLHHLRVVHKADELPLPQIDYSLWDVECHMDDCDFFVLRIESLVRQNWIIYDPRLWDGLLWII